MEQEKVIKLINIIEQLFGYEDIDDLIINDDYTKRFNLFSQKLKELFSECLNENILDMISKLDKKEIFYLEIGQDYKDNFIRKQIVEYNDNKKLYFDFDLIKKYIKYNYKLAIYLKD